MKEGLKSYLNRCRCCLESFSEDEKISPITEFFAIQFYAFTKVELQTDDLLSNHVCEFCHSELLRFSVFKKDLIQKQVTLNKLLKQHNQLLDERHFEQKIEVISNADEYDEIDKMGSISENDTTEASEDEDDVNTSDATYVSNYEITSEEEKSTNSKVNSIKKSYTCDNCNFSCRTKAGICNHVKSHIYKKKGDYKCDKCNFFTPVLYRLQNHKKHCPKNSYDKDFDDKNVPIKSKKIDEDVGTNSTPLIDRKFVEVKSTSQKYHFKCFCGSPFPTKKSFNTHKQRKHGSLKKCHFGCDKSYESIGQWIRHIREYHKTREEECLKMITASKADAWYTVIDQDDPINANSNDLDNHPHTKQELLHHFHGKGVDRENKFECDQCFKLFVSKSSLKTHIQTIHNQVKAFTCLICKDSFKQLAHLNSHIKSVHKHSNKSYSCENCKESFQQLSELKKHQINCQGSPKKIIEQKKKYLICLCKKVFIYPTRLTDHQKQCQFFMNMEKEIKEKNKFKCGRCEKSFVLKGNLVRHQKNVGHL